MTSCTFLINLSLILASRPTLKSQLDEDHKPAPSSTKLKAIESFDSLDSPLKHKSDIVSPESQATSYSGSISWSSSFFNGFDPVKLGVLLLDAGISFQNDTDEFNSSSASSAKTLSLDELKNSEEMKDNKQLASFNNKYADFINQNPNVENFSNEKDLPAYLHPDELFLRFSFFNSFLWLTVNQYLFNRKVLDTFFSSIKIKLDQYESLEEKKLEFIRITKLIAEYCSLQNVFFIKQKIDETLKMHPELSLPKSSMPNKVAIHEINRALCQTFDIFNKSLEEIQTETVMKQNALFTFLEIPSELIPKISGFFFFIFDSVASINNFFTFPNDVPLFKLIVKDECLFSVEELNQLPESSMFKIFTSLIDFLVTISASPLLDKCIKSTDPQAIEEFSILATRFLLAFFFSFMLKEECPNGLDSKASELFAEKIRQLANRDTQLIFKNKPNLIVEAFKSFFKSLPKEGQAVTFNTAFKASIKLLKELLKKRN